MSKNTDKRAERLKQNLRANLLKRKDQTRERANDSAVASGQPEAQTKNEVDKSVVSEQEKTNPKNEQPQVQQDKNSNEQ